MRSLFVLISLCSFLAACSSGHGSGSAFHVSPFSSSATPVDQIDHSGDDTDQTGLAQKFSDIQNDCDPAFKANPTAGLREGATVVTRNDGNYTDGYGRVHNDMALEVASTVQKVIDLNTFTTLDTTTGGFFSVVEFVKHVLKSDSQSSELIQIVSTNPPSLKQIIEKQLHNPPLSGSQKDEVYNNCSGDYADSPGQGDRYSEVVVTLRGGQKYNAIMRATTSNSKNFVCQSFHSTTNAVIAKIKVADYAQNANVDIVSADFVNPMVACYARHRLMNLNGDFKAQLNPDGSITRTDDAFRFGKIEIIGLK